MTDDQKFTTNAAGAPVASDEHSQSVGADGPIALHDVYLVEKLAQFNREKVPERIVHAKGGGTCPRCGHRISQLGSNREPLNFCRGCQR